MLIATRKRTTMLKTCLFSLLDRAADLKNLEILIAFDNDDTDTISWTQENILPEFDELGISYTCLSFERLGYLRINEYYNKLADKATGDWLFFWATDAIMETQDWDSRIRDCDGEFKLLKVHTHNEHPYSIFPIIPAKWKEITGVYSRHQMIDAEVSQIAYMLDLVKIIEVNALHDRHDLTGNVVTNDEGFQNRPMYEGNPQNPMDFHHLSWNNGRIMDSEKISQYLKSIGEDTSWWENVKMGKQDPWEKLKKNDINGQMFQYKAR